MGESAKRHDENFKLIKEIQTSMDAAFRNQGASIKTLEIQIRQISKLLQERGFGSLPSSTEPNPRDHVKSISITIEADTYSIRRANVSVMPLSTYLNLGLGESSHTKLTVELADMTVKYPKGIAENILVGIDHFCLLPGAKIDVFKRKITLRVGDDKIIFKSVKPASSLIKRVYMLSLIERMELDLEARLMGETLVINRSLDPLIGDYIELNDLNEPLELRRNQVNDLMPTIEEGEVIDAPMDDLVKSRDDELDTQIDDYPSDCNYDKKTHIDCAHNLKFSCMIGFEFILSVLDDMRCYRDDGMGVVIVGELFLSRRWDLKKRFDLWERLPFTRVTDNQEKDKNQSQNNKKRARERKEHDKCMRTRSQSRNSNRQQQQVHPTFVEPFNLVEPIENQAHPVVTMADNHTRVNCSMPPTEGYEDAIVVSEDHCVTTLS
ncbi:hypothetical protein Tco_0428294 [Tanacetum coccineum]